MPTLNFPVKAILLITCVLFSSVSAKASPTIEINNKSYLGKWSDDPDVAAFLGIPFAQPPVGELRWRAPQPLSQSSKNERVNASEFAPVCMQSPRILDWYRSMAADFGDSNPRKRFPDLSISEDCLYLNIWTPSMTADSKLPVLVYIHGGSNKSGWSYEPNYHGHNLAKQGAVVVSIAYRLGIFGFFSHPELSEQGVNANFALHDQRLALQWIQQHIAAFGGDASNVTLMGESAGAQNIAYLMSAPSNVGLLHKAILQSAPLLGVPAPRNLQQEQQWGLEFGQMALQSSDTIDLSPAQQLAALRSVPAKQLLALAEQHLAGHDFRPIVDGDLVPAPLHDMLTSPVIPLQGLIIGTNGDEYTSYIANDADEASFNHLLDNRLIKDTRGLTDAFEQNQWREASARLMTANRMLCPAQYLANTISQQGIPVWMYLFDRVRSGEQATQLGAYHGAELPYVFNTHDPWLPTDNIDRQLTTAINRYWLKFAASGSPNDKRATWPVFQPTEPQQLVFANSIYPSESAEQALCTDFFKQAEASTAQMPNL